MSKNRAKAAYKQICKEMVRNTVGYILLNVEIFKGQRDYILRK